MAPKVRADAAAPPHVPRALRPSEKEQMKAKIRDLTKSRNEWKEMALGLKRFVEGVANKSEQNKYAKQVFVDVRRLWTGSRSCATQSKPTSLGRLQRLQDIPEVMTAPTSSPSSDIPEVTTAPTS
jgi:hypothetical protein